MKLSSKPVRLSKTTLSALMMPQDANVRGKVFGGVILKWVDHAAYVAAARHAGQADLVTVSMEKVDFKVPIEIGELVILDARVHYAGRTSVQVGVDISAENLQTGGRRPTNSCLVTFVAVDKKGRPMPVPPVIAETEEEKRLYREAQERREKMKGGRRR